VAIFYATLLISALKTPLLSAAAGFIYLVGRILYALGYYAASEKRARGSFFFLALFYLIGGTLYTAGSLLMST
jgi:glutathione S-transferase